MYKHIEDKRAYIKKWRAKRVLSGWYGQCRLCFNNLGRNEGPAGRNSNSLCINCNKGKNNQNWKGGYINSDGYRVIHIGKGKTKLQHRLVMEDFLKRSLYIDETIHHKNGIRDDNRIENLELWVGAPIRGIKIEDAIEWAKEILKRYNH